MGDVKDLIQVMIILSMAMVTMVLIRTMVRIAQPMVSTTYYRESRAFHTGCFGSLWSSLG